MCVCVYVYISMCVLLCMYMYVHVCWVPGWSDGYIYDKKGEDAKILPLPQTTGACLLLKQGSLHFNHRENIISAWKETRQARSKLALAALKWTDKQTNGSLKGGDGLWIKQCFIRLLLNFNWTVLGIHRHRHIPETNWFSTSALLPNWTNYCTVGSCSSYYRKQETLIYSERAAIRGN